MTKNIDPRLNPDLFKMCRVEGHSEGGATLVGKASQRNYSTRKDGALVLALIVDIEHDESVFKPVDQNGNIVVTGSILEPIAPPLGTLTPVLRDEETGAIVGSELDNPQDAPPSLAEQLAAKQREKNASV